MSVVKVFLAVLICVVILLEAIVVIVRMGTKLTVITTHVLVRSSMQYLWFAHSLIDINECANQNGGCEQNCQNAIGSYSCSCLTGYIIDSNGYNCTGLNKTD